MWEKHGEFEQPGGYPQNYLQGEDQYRYQDPLTTHYEALDYDGEYHLYPILEEEQETQKNFNEQVRIALAIICLNQACLMNAMAVQQSGTLEVLGERNEDGALAMKLPNKNSPSDKTRLGLSVLAKSQTKSICADKLLSVQAFLGISDAGIKSANGAIESSLPLTKRCENTFENKEADNHSVEVALSIKSKN